MKKTRVSATELREWLIRYIGDADNPDLRIYGNGLLEDAKAGSIDRYLWLMTHLMDLGGLYESRVLDVGSGFGWQAMTIAMLGNNKVVANDVRESMTSALSERVEALRRAGAPINVTTLTGDACDLDLESESFDAVYSNQTIEHVHDLGAMFAECARVLRKGGRYLIVDDNNALNKRKLAETREMWWKRDRSGEFVEGLKRQRPIENQGIEPYAVMRERIVRLADTQITHEAVAALVDATAGLTQREIEAMACRTPVIGTPAGAAPQLLSGAGGILVAPESQHDMAKAIIRICTMSDQEWRTMSDAAYATATGYTWDDATDRFEAALVRAVATERHRERPRHALRSQ